MTQSIDSSDKFRYRSSFFADLFHPEGATVEMKLKGVESLYVEKGVEKVLLSVCVTSVEYIQMTSTRLNSYCRHF